MTDIEIEVPLYHPKGCSCAICQAAEALFAELDALHARVAELEQVLAIERADDHTYKKECERMESRIAELEGALEWALERVARHFTGTEGFKTARAALAKDKPYLGRRNP